LGKCPVRCKYPSASHNRWQPGSALVYLKEQGDKCKVTFLIDFVADIFGAVWQAKMKEESEHKFLILVSRKT
jgi:hypothetical protein